ncbi:MAG: ABC transporter ATP-binding protein [Lachnospiraceae bacterium]|nr:ABC transporter ATP-binding protein [Lachnospiraceae bacterium]
MRKHRAESILAPLFKMLEATFDLLVPLVVARIINIGIRGGDKAFILRNCGLLVLMALIGLVCSFTAQYFASRAATGVSSKLRHQLFRHIQSLGFAEMDAAGVPTLITRMTSDVNQVQNGVNLFLRLFLRSPFVVAGAAVMAFKISPRIALIFLGGIAVLSVIVIGIMRITAPKYRGIQNQLDGVTGAARENLEGVRVIRAFGMERREEERFHAVNGALKAAQLRTGRIAALTNPLTYVVVNLCVILILYKGGQHVESGALMSGDVVALINYMNQILVELVKLANLIVTIARAIASMKRVEQVLDTLNGMQFPEKDKAEWSGADEAVRFEHVGMAYRGAAGESLNDISFTALRGQTVGVIGGTGSGKSTLVNLIPRFYEVTDGKIFLEGQPIEDWSAETLRRHIAVVMQKAQLFSGTVRSNLLWGNAEATDEELWQALEIAQAADFVREKEGGLDAKIEQGGRNLSGGQKQRLTIARALVMKPDILILDDSSSALDYATDAALRRALRALPASTTVFIVSQRTSSLRHADRILVLEDGHLAGSGTHDELMASCPVYREIHESQFRKGDEQHAQASFA